MINNMFIETKRTLHTDETTIFGNSFNIVTAFVDGRSTFCSFLNFNQICDTLIVQVN